MESTRWFKPWPNLIPKNGGHRCNINNHFKGHVFTHHPRWRFSPFVGCHIFGGFSVPIKAIFIKVSWKIHVGHAMTGPTKKFWTWQFWWLFFWVAWNDATYIYPTKCRRFWRSFARCHLKMDGWKTIFLLGWLPCRCYITFVCLRWVFTFYTGKWTISHHHSAEYFQIFPTTKQANPRSSDLQTLTTTWRIIPWRVHVSGS